MINRRTHRTILLLTLLATVVLVSPLSAQELPSGTPSTARDQGSPPPEGTASSLVSSEPGPTTSGDRPSMTTLPSSSASSPAIATPPATDVHDVGSADGPPPSGTRAHDTAHPDGLRRAADRTDDEGADASRIPIVHVEIDSGANPDDYPRLAPHEYRYAAGPRYTLTGALPYRESHLRTGTAITFGSALLALATSITWYQQAWYPDSTRAPFHVQTDWGYSKQFDKAGHMFGGWMAAYCSYESFVACGLSADDATLWGSIGGLFFQTFMEVQDGFFSYGFDPTDELSNAIGAGYFYAQQKVPFLRNFDPKWSVGPSNRDSAREASQIRSRIIVDDYDRQDVWLSARLHHLLPESLRPFWPKWLQLALGAGARDVELVGYPPYRELHLALDYNLVELLPDMGSVGNWLIQGLNHFHLPAPALRLWPTFGFELLYPFRL